MRFYCSVAVLAGGLFPQHLIAEAAEYMRPANGPSYDSPTDDGDLASASSMCPLQPTKTVFVTVSPSASHSVLVVSHGSDFQTSTVIVSPIQSKASSQTIKPFTTITIDWSPVTESRVVDSQAIPTSATASSETGLSDGPHLSSYGDEATVSAVSIPEYTVVTDTSVQWVPDTAGVTQITVLSTHTVTLSIHTMETILTNSLSASATHGASQSSDVLPVTECHTYTVLGPDEQPTVVESTVVVSQTTAEESSKLNSGNWATNTALGNSKSVSLPLSEYEVSTVTAAPVHTSFTVLGSDGLPTVVDTTWLIPLPTDSNSHLEDGAGTAFASGTLISGMPFPDSAASVTVPESGVIQTVASVTRCTTFTIIGQDGLPTVTEASLVIPTSTAAPETGIAMPSFVPPPILTNLEQARPTPSDAVISTITIVVIGSDGVVSPVVQTIVVETGAIVSGVLPNPALASTINVPLPLQLVSSGLSVPATMNPPLYGLPPNYQSTPAFSSLLSGIGVPPPVTGLPKHGNEPPAYAFPSDFPLPPYATDDASPTVDLPVGYTPYATDGDWPSSILYGSLPTILPPFSPIESPSTTTALETRTWTNIIPEQTTTYTMKFPLTTMVTVTVPPARPFGKRLMRRQKQVPIFTTLLLLANSSISSDDAFSWTNSSQVSTITLTENTSLMASLSSGLVGQTPTPTPSPPSATITLPTTPINTPPVSTPSIDPSLCPLGGKVGNLTVNFDELSRGPLLNPAGDFWFSEGFLIAPPSSPLSNSYIPSSGGQLVEFVPPALTPATIEPGTGGTAEIGVGPNAAKPCFRFNFYGANLGCAAEGVEQWCEFEFSAYTFNESAGVEVPLGWSEVKRIPACQQFPHGTCALTPVELEGYSNLSSMLIKLRVGLELRAWWGDDFKFGWTDNSCEASSCRSTATPNRVKRDVFDRAAHRGVWQWTPTGLKKLDDDYVWASFD